MATPEDRSDQLLLRLGRVIADVEERDGSAPTSKPHVGLLRVLPESALEDLVDRCLTAAGVPPPTVGHPSPIADSGGQFAVGRTTQVSASKVWAKRALWPLAAVAALVCLFRPDSGRRNYGPPGVRLLGWGDAPTNVRGPSAPIVVPQVVPTQRPDHTSSGMAELAPSMPTGKPAEGDARSQPASGAEPEAFRHSGDYQIHVASFREKSEADAYVGQLHLRGHRAHVEAAHIPKLGVWYRVRIGPFETKAQALAYKLDLDRNENVTTFLVDPGRERQKGSEVAPTPLDVSPSEAQVDYVLPGLLIEDQLGVALIAKAPDHVPSGYEDYIKRYAQAGVAVASHCKGRNSSQRETRIQIRLEGWREASVPGGGTVAAMASDAGFLDSGFAGTEFGNCVIEKFRAVVHPPFEGPARTVVIPLRFVRTQDAVDSPVVSAPRSELMPARDVASHPSADPVSRAKATSSAPPRSERLRKATGL